MSAPGGPAWGGEDEQQVPLLTEEQRRTARAMAGLEGTACVASER